MKTLFLTKFATGVLLGLILALPLLPVSADAAKTYKFAMILPGPVDDADYNYNGYQVMLDVQHLFKIQSAYSENVAPVDSERVASEYISSGHNIIFFYGSQYIRVIEKMAPKFPEVSFLVSTSGKFPLPKNVWNINKFWPEAFHAFGALAGMSTKTNKVGVIAGFPLPDYKGSINSIWLALKPVNPKGQLVYTFTGDSNDPVKCRQAAEAQIAGGVDFIIHMVNLGVYAVAEAAKKAPHKVLLTNWHTDKIDKAPKNFVGTLWADFRIPTRAAVKGILNGEMGGYVEMRCGTGFSLSPLGNVSLEAAEATHALFDKVARGEVKVQVPMDEVILK